MQQFNIQKRKPLESFLFFEVSSPLAKAQSVESNQILSSNC